INWQLAPTKRFDPDDIKAFFALLPGTIEGVRLRHAVEVRHESFDTPEFVKLAKAANVAIVHAQSADYPNIASQTSDFTYARIMRTRDSL
ncbi:DUF72 domain-containing protein, partial [Clostridium sp. ZBS15]|uniref:DUF72 domain-containing protein n=1 Tax=Clostridium sp. ZBS15 TaxID=2949969 RepID=UPI00207A4979